MEQRPKNRARYRLLIILFALAAAYQIAFTIQVIGWFARGADRVMRPFTLSDGSNRVSDPEYAAKDGLHAGDELLDLDGRKYTGSTILSRVLRAKHPGDMLPSPSGTRLHTLKKFWKSGCSAPALLRQPRDGES